MHLPISGDVAGFLLVELRQIQLKFGILLPRVKGNAPK